MASSRPLRKSSRMSSPLDVAMKDSSLSKDEIVIVRSKKSDSWEEPPLRPPAPSFEDYKGLERQGVLEHMAPLGSLPNQKVKLRLKAHDVSRRNMHGKNGEVTVSREEPNVPDPTVPSVTRRSEPRKLEDRPSKLISLREKDDDQDYIPKGFTKTTPAKASPSQPSNHGTPSSRTSAGQIRLRQVVESAVERSNELGNPILGLAVKKLFEESLQNRMLADLLDAVLSQNPTARQATDFQGYIKVAKKQIKAETRSRRHSSHSVGINSKSVSMSPSKSTRPSVVRQTGIAKDLSDMTSLNNFQSPDHSSTQHLLATQQPQQPQQLPSNQQESTAPKQAKNMEGNGSLSREERPARRRKISRSVSTSSSLSSLPSTEDRDFSPTFETNLPDGSKDHPSTQPLQGPKPPPLSIKKQSNSNKRPAPVNTNPDDSADELNAKRRKFQKTFDDYVVHDSEIRTMPLPKKPATLPSFAASFVGGRAQQSRLRNGTSQGSRKDDYDDLQSPGSSTQGELLIPPPAGARSTSRGVTPNQLGRPAKQLRKAARVKMSPMKGKTGVIAGIARPVRGRRDDSEDHENISGDNSDICFTCGGSGQLLCCDGCTRSFHFTCVDPPVRNIPGETWYCIDCKVKQDRPTQPNNGVFSGLVYNVETRNPSAFYLPYEVRDFFQGVKTGEEGEFEEVVATKAKTKAGYEEVPNNCKLKDGKDNTILCFSCGKSSLGNRQIISCDFCSLCWHLDCLDPPLAVAPRRSNNGKAKSWKCPNHVDVELQALGSTNKAGQKRKASGRYIKPREPKRFRLLTPAIPRGFINDGCIRVINPPSPSDDQDPEDSRGIVYNLPEKAIRLDFIDRVKQLNAAAEQGQLSKSRARDASRLREAASLKARREADDRAEREREQEARREAEWQARKEAENPLFGYRSMADRQAALDLVYFAQSLPGVQQLDGQVTNLVNTLIAEAPLAVHAPYSDDAALDVAGPVNGESSSSVAPPEVASPKIPARQREKSCLELLQTAVQTRLGVINAQEALERQEHGQGQAPEQENSPEEEEQVHQQGQKADKEPKRAVSLPADESGEA